MNKSIPSYKEGECEVQDRGQRVKKKSLKIKNEWKTRRDKKLTYKILFVKFDNVY